MDYKNMIGFDNNNKATDCLIKVIGVGGGGGNAVNHMYEEGIEHVNFALCNTDGQVLMKSAIPQKLQIGSGLGAGGDPDKGEKIANDSLDDIHDLLDDGTQMAFITATMGGGTGTGAGPIVAKVAKEMGILTVGIVTIPFLFEGMFKIRQALNGVDNMAKNVDALLVINNERLRLIYSDLEFDNAFKKADDTLTVAAKSIVDMINATGEMNIDFADVSNTLKDGGVAIITTGYASGEGRVQKAIDNALHSPLLNSTDVYHAKKMCLHLAISHKANFMMEEMNAIHQFMNHFNKNIRFIWGWAFDDTFDDDIKITILASGFGVKDIDIIDEANNSEPEEVDDPRILDAYGSLLAGDSARGHKKRYIHIFTEDELNDDDIISVIDSSPTYDRDINATRSLGKNNVQKQQRQADTSNVITF